MVKVYQEEPVSDFLDEHILYYRIHKDRYDAVLTAENMKGIIHPKFFNRDNECMSTNWSRHSSAEQLKLQSRTPDDNGVVEFTIKCLYDVPLSVKHKPKQPTNENPVGNPSHCCVYSFNKIKKDYLKQRRKLASCSSWSILPEWAT